MTMEQNESGNRSLPGRGIVLVLFGLNGAISAVSGLSFINFLGKFPWWFGPVFIFAVLLLLGIISFYIWQVLCTAPGAKSPSLCEQGLIWLLLVLSIICTFALQ